MPLVVDQLQLWTIGFKWAELDPSRFWPRIPGAARDNFSTLLEAILSEHLECLTLASEKYTGDDPEIAKCHIRYWLKDVNDGIHGVRYERRLLKWAVVERWAFQDWCQRRSIPLPEFWFPPGWTDYRWPECDEPEPVANAVVSESGRALESAVEPDRMSLAMGVPPKELRDNQIARIASQQIARAIWKENGEMTIAAMCRDPRVLKYGGAEYYAEDVVRRWVKDAAPREVSAKRGRPKKKNATEDE